MNDLAPPHSELDLLRAQLSTLSDLLLRADQTGPSDTSAETRLLRDQLACLVATMDLAADAPALPSAPSDFEAAIARLLADLVQETDRRILAEQATHAAHKALRHLGHEPPANPGRPAAAPRPA